MTSPLLTNLFADSSPSNLNHHSRLDERNSPRLLDNPGPAPPERDAHQTNNLGAYGPLRLSGWPRQPLAFTKDGDRLPSRPPALLRGLATIKHFFFAQDKTLHDGYIPNYRFASSIPLHLFRVLDPSLSAIGLS
jgi:hypothetical protein